MEVADIGTAKLAYRIFGNGGVNIVIEAALNSCSAEWWHIAEGLANRFTVLVYDRAGYGTSSVSQLKRTPQNIADELYQLILKVGITGKIVFIGHSQGGLYIQQFVRSYPELVKGIILVDPLSANDDKFMDLLSPGEYKKSGVNKLQALKMGAAITSIGLGFLLKPLLKKAPPFYYCKDFSEAAVKYMLSCLIKSKQYKTAVSEYLLSHMENEIKDLKVKGNFPEIPLILVTHNSKACVEEIMYYGNTTKELAEKIESIWQNIMKEYLYFSPKAKLMQAEKSSHYIHLTEFEIVESALDEALKSCE